MKELFESSFLSAMSEANDNLRQEIERLNKIINALEKWTWYYQDQVIKDKGQYAQDMINQSYYDGKIDGIQGIIDKIKELKENKQ